MTEVRKKQRIWPRVVLLAGAGAGLLSGLDAALVRLGAWAPVPSTQLGLNHGIIMVLGFIGGAISLERAVAARRWWAYLAPAACIAGTIATIAGARHAIAGIGYLAGMLILTGLYVYFWHRQPQTALLAEGLGALCGVAAAALWMRGLPTPTLVPHLLFFPIFTIIGERLELARIAWADSRREGGLLAICAATWLALICGIFSPAVFQPLLGILVIAMAAIMASTDVARRTIRAAGLTRFMAASMLAGYFWLAVSGAIWVLAGPLSGGYLYETLIHALTLGFTMSMIFAHAPVIIPSVVHRNLPYTPVMWVPLVVLHAGLAIRFGIGAARNLSWWWRWGGTLNVAAVIVFMITVLVGTLILASPARAKRKAAAKKGGPSCA